MTGYNFIKKDNIFSKKMTVIHMIIVPLKLAWSYPGYG